MRVLHVTKTSRGALWAAGQARRLSAAGVDIHVALPALAGEMVPEWQAGGARVHVANLDWPSRAPWRLQARIRCARELVEAVKPDLIHIHHVGPALLIRTALRNRGPLRIFQVPGPLHLEHVLFRRWELATSTERDYWIATSRYILRRYLSAGIARKRLFLSYHGTEVDSFRTERTYLLRRMLRLPDDAFVVGNVSHIYPPKYYLGQFVGLKAHEDLIRAMTRLVGSHANVFGVLIGSVWGDRVRYEQRLRGMAERLGSGRVLMPGHLSHEDVRSSWRDFDCAVHAPISENCGGVVEPLLCGVPTIAASVGGLPEVVMTGLTGLLVRKRRPDELALAIEEVFQNRAYYARLAETGRAVVRKMFDINRTATEVYGVYSHILDGAELPEEFDSTALAQEIVKRR